MGRIMARAFELRRNGHIVFVEHIGDLLHGKVNFKNDLLTFSGLTYKDLERNMDLAIKEKLKEGLGNASSR